MLPSRQHLTRGLKHALLLLRRRQWRELLIRIRIALGHIDLKVDPTEAVSERTHYYADSGGLAFDGIMSYFAIAATDAIVDFGCGKGGILISLSKYPFARITGIEISPDLVGIARDNIRKLKIKNVDIQCCDAADFKQLDTYNYFYFFDPFPDVVMADVLGNIEQSLIDHPRKVTLIYLNPYCHELIESGTVFSKTGAVEHFEHDCFIYTNQS
ncbi:MAG: class I SAM-dependent methyltransferase [Desulfuromonadales bacterium]